jgi:hypothetical protein
MRRPVINCEMEMDHETHERTSEEEGVEDVLNVVLVVGQTKPCGAH